MVFVPPLISFFRSMHIGVEVSVSLPKCVPTTHVPANAMCTFRFTTLSLRLHMVAVLHVGQHPQLVRQGQGHRVARCVFCSDWRSSNISCLQFLVLNKTNHSPQEIG
ncbi:unnamed protein product [Chondrus crispus]|uniref:Uncharacterized protein n=1 Tax=Chondrus crispus TaxID=2769 RepID=R7QE40_CHOCR|nr:unnamed protein product [Chondrus crispus]CDF35700.1 unnamed protein product [Chondrus crispus]|eukprot:XP_005715519.1 unnamed protein product [Chondrus crispus]